MSEETSASRPPRQHEQDERREEFINNYIGAELKNRREYNHGNAKATKEYIWANQKFDAQMITNIFWKDSNKRIVSVKKKTKVGADGLMIEIVNTMCTHSDNDFVVDWNNVRIITGMSNKTWQSELCRKVPQCINDKISHHGQLKKIIMNVTNGLIIIDEIDTGDGQGQVLDKKLKSAGILDIELLKKRNNRIVVISATMKDQLKHLVKDWGDLHEAYKMTIPESYIGHKEFLDLGIIQEWYSLNSKEAAEKWVQEDIIDNYGTIFRIHLVRVDNDTLEHVKCACEKLGVEYKDHTSEDRISDNDLKAYFEKPLIKHMVIAVKGFWRRADLIPNKWKLRIGAVHEKKTEQVNVDVQIQGFIGRMSGPGEWKDSINGGHKTGPYRTSKEAIVSYDKWYNDDSMYSNVVKNKKPLLAGNNVNGLVEVVEDKNNSQFEITEPFKTDKECDDYLKSIKKDSCKYTLSDRRTFRYRNKDTDIMTYTTKDDFKSKDIYWGLTQTSARRMPIIYNNEIWYIGVYKITKNSRKTTDIITSFQAKIDINKHYDLKELTKILIKVYQE
jgi:hypothetical protein